MAEIFLALQKGEQGFQKPVVLKRILPALAADPKFVRMFVDEAHIASRLNHSNLVQVLDLGKSGDQYFLVLEFVDGWSLEQVRRRAQQAKLKLPIPLALQIVGALCRGLAYVHTRERNGQPLGIVHRDVTPQNVLLSQQGEVKLADFGIAKAVGRTREVRDRRHQGEVRVHVARAIAGPAARRALGSVFRRHRALPPHHGAEAVRRADGRGRPDGGPARAAREALEGRARSESRRRAVDQPRPARRPREALAERRADGGPDRRHPREAGTAERAGAAQALAGDAERPRRRQAARRRRDDRERSEHRRRSRQPGSRARGRCPDGRRSRSRHRRRHASPGAAHPRRGHRRTTRPRASAPAPAPPLHRSRCASCGGRGA